MIRRAAQFSMYALVLVCGMALEEAFPKVLGVGFPVLLAAVQFLAARREDGPLAAVAFALAAGLAEDAISSLAPLTSVSAFVMVAVLARRVGSSFWATLFTYPCYQVWLSVWASNLGGGVFGRFILSLPIGCVTALAVGVILGFVSRKAALYERS